MFNEIPYSVIRWSWPHGGCLCPAWWKWESCAADDPPPGGHWLQVWKSVLAKIIEWSRSPSEDEFIRLSTSQLWGEDLLTPSPFNLGHLLGLMTPLHQDRLPRILAKALLFCGRYNDTKVWASCCTIRQTHHTCFSSSPHKATPTPTSFSSHSQTSLAQIFLLAGLLVGAPAPA